ncbi:Hypothetical predicted protein, partial [Olea europaea subsp. europaea]
MVVFESETTAAATATTTTTIGSGGSSRDMLGNEEVTLVNNVLQSEHGSLNPRP